MAEWLDGISDEDVKSMGKVIMIDGRYYDFEGYDALYKLHNAASIGDTIHNPYTQTQEKIKEIERDWWSWCYGVNKGYEDACICEMIFITETGYIIYDLND